jgi:hypothetical protein
MSIIEMVRCCFFTHESSWYGGEEHFLASDWHPSVVVLHITNQLLQLKASIIRSAISFTIGWLLRFNVKAHYVKSHKVERILKM